MTQFFSLISDFWISIFDLFDRFPLSIAGYHVSFFDLIFAFLVIGFVISYFWKGAKT